MGDSESPLRKRRRSSGGSLAKRIALENATVPICFDDQRDKVYNLPWSDLLQENELPFESYEDLTVGKVVLAPWKHRGSGIHFSKACVVEAGYKPQLSCASGEAPSTPTKSPKADKSPKKRPSPRKPRKTGAKRKLATPTKPTKSGTQSRSPAKKSGGKGQGHIKSVSQDTMRKKASEAMDHNILAILENNDGENASVGANADMEAGGIWPKEGSVNEGDQAQRKCASGFFTSGNEPQGGSGTGADGQNSTTGNGSQGGSDTGAGGQNSTTGNGPQGGSGTNACEQNSTAGNGPQGGSGTSAGGQNSTAGNGPQGGSSTCTDEQNSTTGDEPMEKDDGVHVYNDGCYYFDGPIGTETDVQTTPHSVFSRGYQDIYMRRSFSQPPQHRSPQPQIPFQMPTPLSRRYTYPPHVHGSYSEIDWPPLSDDNISLFSQPSGVSSEHTCKMSSKDLSFVYNNWIAPLTEKLKDIETQFRAISMGLCVPPSTPSSLNSSRVISGSNQPLDSDSFIDQYSTSRRSSLQSVSSQPPQTYTSSAPDLFFNSSVNQHLPTSSLPQSSLSSSQSLPGSSRSSQTHSTSELPPGSSRFTQAISSSQPILESCNSSSLDQPANELYLPTNESSQPNASSASATTGEQPGGLFLGYPEKDKHRVWVKCKREDILAAEGSAGDYNQLANALLDIVFEEELQTPDKYCCTSSKGKELLNEEKMRGIRIHLHRKYLNRRGIKLNSVEEKTQWKDVKKKMNNHIRYLRRRSKGAKDAAEVDSDI